jgi:hypothetical protein
MMNLSFKPMLLLIVLCLSLMACGGGITPPSLPPIIPTTTKVADANTRQALQSFDAQTGTMRFARVTPSLAALQADDVLVSEPSSAAPDGYLRKVKAIRQDGTAVVLETIQANLTDAISEGSLNASGGLQAADVRSARALVPGVRVGVIPRSDIDVGDGYRFYVGFDQTVLDINEPNVKAKVRVTGELKFNAGYNIGFDIRGPRIVPPRLPSLEHFEAWVGFEQRAKLSITGDAVAKLNKELKVAEYRFTPKCFEILFVPICVVPTVYVFVGASGEVQLHFAYEASQTARAKLGAAWDKDRGWSRIDPTPTLETTFNQQLDVSGGLKASAFLRADAALMLYGVAGLAVGGKLGIELDAAFPRNPLWILRGQVEGYYRFLVDVPVIGRVSESGDTLFSFTKEAGRSANSVPKLALTGRSASGVPLGLPTTLLAGCSNSLGAFLYTAYDPEDGCGVKVRVRSSADGEIANNHEFQTAGTRTITVTAQDTNGATASIAFDLNVLNTPPVVYGSLPYSTQATVPSFFKITATDQNTGQVGCAAITVTGVMAQLISTQDGDCLYSATFMAEGTQSFEAVATDPQGAISEPKSFSVRVNPAPASPPPVWNIPPGLKLRYQDNGEVIANESHLDCGRTVIFSASASDPNGKPVDYIWQLVYEDGMAVTLPTNADGTTSFTSGSVINNLVQVRVFASNGSSQTNPLTQNVLTGGCVQ